MNTKGIAILPVVVIVAGLLAFGATGYFLYSSFKNTNERADTNAGLVNLNTNEGIPCTADAKLCPDGSSVGRTGPNCEFAACPGMNANTNVNASADVTKDWTMHLNEKGWSIRFPKTYQQSITRGFTKPDSVVKVAESTDIDSQYAIYIEEYPNDASNRSTYAWQSGGYQEPYPAGFVDKESVALGNIEATRFKVNVTGQDVHYYYIKTASTMFRIEDRRIGSGGEANEDIIKTFRVTDPTAGWKTYTNTALGFSIRTPQNWEVDTTRSTANEIVFLPNSGTESREAIKSVVSDQMVADWQKTFDTKDITEVSSMTVAGQPATRITTNAFALNYIAFRYDDRMFVVTSNTKLIDLGILSTFTLTK